MLVAACGASASAPSVASGGPGAPGASVPGGLTPGPANPTPVPGTSTWPGSSPSDIDPGFSGGGSSSGGTSGGGGSSGGAPGNAGTGAPADPGTGAVPDQQPRITTPTTGLLDIRAVGASRLVASIDGRHVSIRVDWWSGIEPCSVLAGVIVARDGSAFTLTVQEGDTGAKVACDEIALYKGTFVDLGLLDPGTYTVKAFGDAPAIRVDVTG